jgi:hypothetical protein
VAYKVFTNGSVLNASEINENLMNQSIIVFSNEAARTAAITSPIEGMVTYLEDTAAYESYDGAAWIGFGGGSGILQVVSTSKTDTFSVASVSLTNITGLSATITPSSATSKILVLMTLGGVDVSTDLIVAGDVTRNGTQIGIGDADFNRLRAGWLALYATSNKAQVPSYNFLDSPASTSALTYQARIRSNAGTVYVNRTQSDQNTSDWPRSISTITLMEVAG